MILTKTNLAATGARRFEFARDSFSFPNELVWEYQLDAATGKRVLTPRNPKPEYAHRCFAMTRIARQFFYHAQFVADQTGTTDETYRQLVRAVLARHPRIPCKPEDRIIIPGFAGLREFSRVHERLLKIECGGAWRSYFLRSHWRMIVPFSRAHQANTAAGLAAALKQNRLPIVHIVKFPSLTINHCIVLFNAVETKRGWEFESYDPNNADEAERLTFDGELRTFFLEPNACWNGGPLNASHIIRSWFF